MLKVTTHTIAANEDKFIYFALSSVIDFVSEALVYNDNSTDKTGEMISLINSPKLKEVQKIESKDVADIRNKLIEETKTDWFILLDGDEIWNKNTFLEFLNFLECQPKNILAVSMRTKNFVGDVYHIMPEDAGMYELQGRKGHLTTRAFRKKTGFYWRGNYPLEYYADSKGVQVTKNPDNCAFFEGSYWHASHLERSSNKDKVPGFRSKKIEKGISVGEKDLPEVFFHTFPESVESPLVHRSLGFETKALFLTPLKKLKRKL